MQAIYKPKGRAGEYAEYALNIYTGCPHGCTYCYMRKMNKRFGKEFDANIRARDGIINAVRTKQRISKMNVFLCFSCDPYPVGIDNSITREVINWLKQYTNITILTKGRDAARDFDLLTPDDSFGVTLTGRDDLEPNAATNAERIELLKKAKERGIQTWVSFEPLLDPQFVLDFIRTTDFVDVFKIGKLNYGKDDIDYTIQAEHIKRICELCGKKYVFKKG
jgi:DNA repair photolyase